MNFQQAIQTCFRKYLDFNGRAARSEYWWFFLFYLIVQLVAGLIHPRLPPVLALVFLLPLIFAVTRRLHDTDRSGWWQLLGFVPVIGWLVVLYFLVQPSEPGSNRFGEPPLLGSPSGAPL